MRLLGCASLMPSDDVGDLFLDILVDTLGIKQIAYDRRSATGKMG